MNKKDVNYQDRLCQIKKKLLNKIVLVHTISNYEKSQFWRSHLCHPFCHPTVAVKMLDKTHKQTNKKQPFLRLLISFWFQNNRLEISFSEHIEPFHSYECEQSYAIFSDWNDLKISDNFMFYVKLVYQDFFKVSPDWFFFPQWLLPWV